MTFYINAPVREVALGQATKDGSVSVTIASDQGGINVQPVMVSGGNISTLTSAVGTNYTAFAAQACKQVTICNDTGTTVEVRQGGAGVAIPVFDSTYYTFFGITDASQLAVRRKDTSNTQVTVKTRWES